MPAGPPRAPADAGACAVGPDLWYREEADGTFVVGLTDSAQRRAGPLAHYRGPEVGRAYRAGEAAMSLESEKWVGHLGLPVDGTVVGANADVERDPALVNRDPYGAGWLYRVRPRSPGAFAAASGTPR